MSPNRIMTDPTPVTPHSGSHLFLQGLDVLIVEDETMVAFLIEDMLHDLGCARPRHVSSVQEALDALAADRPDVAVLDVNLGGEKVYPVAERLEAAGVPFLFATGYGTSGMPVHWTQWPVIQKPFRLQTLATALRSALAERRNGKDDARSQPGHSART